MLYDVEMDGDCETGLTALEEAGAGVDEAMVVVVVTPLAEEVAGAGVPVREDEGTVAVTVVEVTRPLEAAGVE